MSQQPIDIVVRVQQLTAQAFDQVARELKKLETSATDAGKAASGPLASGARAADDATRHLASGLQTATSKTTLLGSAMGSVKTIAAGFLAGFTVDRVVTGLANAVSSTIAWGGALTDMAAKTGVSTTALQRWEFAAKQGGNTLEQVVKASGELSKRLTEGQGSTVAALERLGLNLTSLQQLSPEQQFDEVAAALARTSDQGTRASASMALLGDSGKELLPTLTSDMKALGDEAERLGVIVDEQTLQAMDDLGDSWEKAKDAGRGLLAEALSPMVPEFNRLAGAAANAAKAIREDFWGALFKVNEAARGGLFFGALFGQQFGGPGKPAYTPSSTSTLPAGLLVPGVTTSETVGPYFTPGVDDFVNGVRMVDLDPKLKAAAEAAAKHAAEMAAFAKEAAVRWRNIVLHSDFLMARMGQVAMGFTPPGLEAATVLGGQANPWGGVGMSGPGGGSANFSYLTRPGVNWGNVGLAGLGSAMPFLSQLVTGGSRGGQIGGSVGGTLGGILGSKDLFGGLSGLGGFAGVLGAAAPFMGPILGLVGGLVGKLFGPSRGAVLGREADQRMDQTRAGLLQQFGSLDAIAATGRAGAELVAGWQHKNVTGEREFNKLVEAFREQNGLLAEQQGVEAEIAAIEAERKALNDSLKTTWDQIVGITEKYGISLEGLGGQVVQLGQTTTWTQMLNDIQALERAGADVGGILVGMTDEMSALVQQSLRAGTEIPANLRPYLQSVADAGKLLDENGVAITDLSTLKWGEPVKTQADIVKAALEKLDTLFSDLTTKLDQIIDRLTNGLPSAASTPMPTVRIPFEWEDVGGGPGGRPDEGEPGYATGGLITRTQRALVHEGELIGPVAFMERALAGALRRTGQAVERVIEVPVYLEGRLVARGVAPYLASAAR